MLTHPNWFSENTVPATAPSVNSVFIVSRLKIIIGRKIASCRMQITTDESTPCSAYLTAHNFLYIFSQRILLSFCQELLFQLQNHYKSLYNLRHSATTKAVYIWWVEGLSSRSTGCLTSLHNLGWNFLKTCTFSHPKSSSFVEWMLGAVLSVSSKARCRTSVIVKPNSYSGFSVYISLNPPAVQAEDRVFSTKKLPVFECSVFVLFTVHSNAIL
jgi:hypothetical protein